MEPCRKNKLFLVLVLFVVVSFAFLPCLAIAIPIVSVQPSTSTIYPGDTFNLSVGISDVTDLFAFQFDIGFDPAILSAVSVTEGPFLPSGGSTFFVPGTIDNIAGSISFNADSLIGTIPGVNGTGTLATLSFQALALGTSSVDLFNVILLDSGFSDISFNSAGALVSAVPEPATILLLGSGLLGVMGLRKKLKK